MFRNRYNKAVLPAWLALLLAALIIAAIVKQCAGG